MGDPLDDYLRDPFNEFGTWTQADFDVFGDPTPSNIRTSNVRITEIGEVAGADLPGLIKQNGGHYDAATSDSLVQYARSRWWQFSVQLSRDGATARITETNYVLYGGVALGAVVLLTALAHR